MSIREDLSALENKVERLEERLDREINCTRREDSDNIFELLWGGEKNLTLNARIEMLKRDIAMLEEYLAIEKKTTPAKPETTKYIKKKK